MSVRKRRALGAVSAVAALAITGGVAAQFNTSTDSVPQSIGTGTMALSLDNVSPMTWTQPIANLAAGDSVQRFVDVRNSGSLKMSGITLSQSNTLGDLLGAPSDVAVTLESCSVAWNTTTGTCTGTQMVVLGQNSVRGWASSAKNLSTFEAFGAGEVRHLRFTTTVDAGATNAVQNKSGEIVYTFNGSQRGAGTWGDVSDAHVALNSPGNVVVTPSGNDLVVSFADTNAGQVAYVVGTSVNGGTATTVTLGKGQTSYTVANATPGATYDFSVGATAGAEAVSAPAPSVAVLQAPGLSVTQTGTTALKATIVDKSGGKASYSITYTPAGGTAQTVTLPAGTLSYDLTGLQLATDYTVSTTATLGGQTKSASVTSTLPVSQASAVTLTSTDTTMAVSWTDANAGQATYSVSYVPTAGGTTKTSPVAAGSNSASITGLSANTSYDVSVVTTKGAQTQTVVATKSTTAPVFTGSAKFNPAGSWSSVASLTGSPGTSPSSAMGADGNIYTFGGSSSPSVVRQYNPSNNAWTTRASMPTGTYLSTAQTANDGSIYVFGGYGNSTVLKTVQKYSPGTDSWTTVAPMPTAIWYGTSTVAADGSIYVLGGYSGGAVNIVQKYNPTTDTWTTVAPMPLATYYATSQTAADGSIYVFGGQNGSTYYANVQKYTPSSNTWVAVQAMPTATGERPTSAVANDGSIYVFGGYNSAKGALNTVQKYTPDTNKWTTEASLPWARQGANSVVDAQGRMYLIGGTKTGGSSTSVDRLG